MAPLKLEEHLKDKLKDREITPSDKSWSKLAAGLDNQPKNEKNKKSVYFTIVACLLGLLIASAWFFNIKEPSKNSQQVVDLDSNEESIFKKNTPIKEENTTAVVSKEVSEKEEQNTVIKQSEKITTIENQFKISKQHTEIATQEKISQQLKANQQEKIFLDAKLNVVMKKLALLEESNATVTDAEVDSLLRSAQQEILAEKAIKAGMSVDAMVLLIEAESELDVSFRDNFFDNLKRRYLKLKTTVAARTN